MEYVPFNNISKRNIDQTISNGNESFIVFNKRTCITEEVKFHLKDSRQNLKLHVNPKWNCINKDFEHATNSESMKLHRTNGVPIIFHFASEEIMDLENYGSDNLVTELTSIHSAVSVRKYTILVLDIVILFEFLSNIKEKIISIEPK